MPSESPEKRDGAGSQEGRSSVTGVDTAESIENHDVGCAVWNDARE